jgi:hypothetical protein
MTSDAGFRDYAAESLARLQQRGIIADSRFASDFGHFIMSGFDRSVQEGASRIQIEEALDQLVEAVLSYAAETGTDRFGAKVFTRIRRRICPGFWPFC